MSDNNNPRSGLQTAANLARAAKAVYRVIQAAAVSGAYGAAVAAAKEALPFLIKILIGILIVVIVIPMVIFTALPNIFFGYSSSDTDTVIRMTEQAMAIGGAYMSLEDFEKTQIDSVVTSIAAEYEEDGTAIDRIIVNNSMNEEDLLWLIAINSAAYQQDLDSMSAALIREFCKSRISYVPTLGIADGGDDATVTTLKVEVKRLDPEEMMDQLGFDEDAKLWARALFETLEESDAINEYATYYNAYQPDYGGDRSYTGDIQYGTEYDNKIDISGFIDPSTKNNLDLAAYAIQAWENNWGYVWGTFGSVLTESLLDYKIEQYPNGVGNHETFIKDNWLGRRTTDCVGLIKGYGWLDAVDGSIQYGTNGMPDYSANQMYQAAKNAGIVNVDYGPIGTMPEVVGLAVWKDGHIGVYVGNGYVVEAMNTQKGVVKTQVEGRGWLGWCKIPYIDYLEDGI